MGQFSTPVGSHQGPLPGLPKAASWPAIQGRWSLGRRAIMAAMDLLEIGLLVLGLLVAWFVLRWLLRLTMRIFSIGCAALVVPGAVLLFLSASGS